MVLLLEALLLFVRNRLTISVKPGLTEFSLEGDHVTFFIVLGLVLLFLVGDHVTFFIVLGLMLLFLVGDWISIGVKLRLTLLPLVGDWISISIKLGLTWWFRASPVLSRVVFLDFLSILGSIGDSPVGRIAWLGSQVYLRCLRDNVFIILSFFLSTSESLGSLREGDTGLSL